MNRKEKALALAHDVVPVNELSKLEKFTGGDPEAAEHAFSYLSGRIERYLWRYLSTLVPGPQDREDVIVEVLKKLYDHRSKFQVKGLGAWYALVALMARRCALDRLQKGETVPLDDDLPVEELEFIGNVAELTYFRSLLYRAADGLWLGIDPRQADAERKRRLLAAQLYYLHGTPWQEVCRHVGREKPLGRRALDSWLSDPAVLNDLAFHMLYFDNDSLACHILGNGKALDMKALREIALASEKGSGEPPEGWTWPEVKVAIWRYRNGLLTEKILQMDPGLGSTEVERTLAKCRERLPFEQIAVELEGCLQRGRAPLFPLKSAPVWKRLVFQYATIHELSHKQILERTEAAARVSGFSLTPAMLNSWLSNGRLALQLTAYAKKEQFA